jgi:thiosulfate/3-mercaptopyruvate sulfurtransferase
MMSKRKEEMINNQNLFLLNYKSGGTSMKKSILIIIVLSLFILTSAGISLAATWANPELLMDAKQVKEKVGNPDWVFLDCRKLKDYAKGHIPGAISIGKQCKKALRDKTSRVWRDTSKYEKLFSKVGIGNDTHVVIYGEHVKSDTMKDTTVAFWILEYLGHDKVHVLNGGIDAWKNEGYKMDNKPTILKAKTFKANVAHSRYATTDEALDIAKGKKKGTQVIDARTAEELKGADQRSLRAGRLPNTTINVSHKDTFDQTKDLETGKMKDNGFLSYERVADFYKDLDKNKRTVAFCQTGTRSTLTYLELRLLGFKDPANWDESWRVYGSSYNDYPIENEQWFDFNRMRKAEKKIKKLEEKLEALAPKEDEKK